MASKSNKNAALDAASREVDQLLDSYAAGRASGAGAALKETLSSFSGWLPYLARKLQSGPAPLRKAAARILKDSGTRSGIETVQAAASDARLPAWLRLAAHEALAPSEQAEATGLALAQALSLSAAPDAFPEAPPDVRKASIQLMVDRGEWSLLANLFGSSEDLLSSILDAVVEHETEAAGIFLCDLLGRAAGKDQEKQLRRAWHALRQRGLAIPELRRGGPREVERPRDEMTAYASHVDAEGSRMVLVLKGRAHDTGGDLLQFILNDERGIIDFSKAWIGKRDLRPLVDELAQREKGLRLAPLDPAWAMRLAADAYQTSRRAGRDVPEQYVRERHIFEEGLDLGALATEARARIPSASVASVDPQETLRLLDLREIEAWGPSIPVATPFAERYLEIEEGPIVTSAELKAGRLAEEIDRGVREHYEASRSHLMGRRLEEMASFYLRLGLEEESRFCLAAADLLMGSEVDPAKSCFLRALWERRVTDLVGLMKERKKSDLVQPGSAILP